LFQVSNYNKTYLQLLQSKYINKNYFRSVDQVLLASLSVDIGIHNRKFKDPWAIISSVSKVIVHENFIDQIFNNDIALIKLEV